VPSNFSIEFNYNPIKNTKFEEIDSTLRLHNDDLGTIKVTDLDGKGPYTYKGYEIRFNGPSEHRIDNKMYNMEM
jgi:carbonic anhydrase